MNKKSATLTVSLMIVAAIVGIAFGYYLTPSYRLTMYEKSNMDLGKPDKWLDLRYIDAMIEHHEGAILLAGQALENSNREQVRNLAVEIRNNEPKAIDELYSWKKEWYKDTNKVKLPIVSNLGDNKDGKFDLRFLNALIAHHERGLVMTDDVLSKSTRTEIIANADSVKTFLNDTVKVFKDWRKQWYNI